VKVPFVDLKAQYEVYRTELDAAIRQVIDATAFVGGKFVKEFEGDYARAFGVKHCISCANGTDAIYIALRMLGIGPGDEVITTAASWISTSETIGQTGATPVFVDVDDHYNIDPEQIDRAITPRTKAVVPVHLYGQAARMDAITAIARKHGLMLVEDCAQAHYATFAGQKAGTFGVAATFSFYPGKNLGAYGDAGAIITNDDELARKFRMYANHGALKKHEHEIEGINSRLDGIQAAILRTKLPHLAEWTARRQAIARRYDEKLAAIREVVVPTTAPGATHVYHLYVVRVPERDALRMFLQERGIETGIHYPGALPFLGAYRGRGFRPEQFPRAHRNQGEIVSLPMYAELTDGMIDYVVGQIGAFFGQRA
jgi:dTDP-4-amino-4,6-dideoxygalactose transaminase